MSAVAAKKRRRPRPPVIVRWLVDDIGGNKIPKGLCATVPQRRAEILVSLGFAEILTQEKQTPCL